MKYRVMVYRLPENDDVLVDPIYEGDFDANEDTADEIGEMAGGSIEEAIQCDVVAQMDGKD